MLFKVSDNSIYMGIKKSEDPRLFMLYTFECATHTPLFSNVITLLIPYALEKSGLFNKETHIYIYVTPVKSDEVVIKLTETMHEPEELQKLAKESSKEMSYGAENIPEKEYSKLLGSAMDNEIINKRKKINEEKSSDDITVFIGKIKELKYILEAFTLNDELWKVGDDYYIIRPVKKGYSGIKIYDFADAICFEDWRSICYKDHPQYLGTMGKEDFEKNNEKATYGYRIRMEGVCV